MNGREVKVKMVKMRIDLIKLALSIQLTVLGLTLLKKMGMRVPVLSEIIVFVYLSLIPGLLVLKIFKVHTTLIKLIVLSVGISISTTTLSFALWNAFAMYLFDRPLSDIFLLIVLGSLLSLLMIFVALRDDRHLSITFEFRSIHLVLFIIPILILISKIGECYWLMFVTLVLISLIFLISIRRREIHPLTVWVTSLSLLLLTRAVFKETFNMWPGDYPGLSKAVVIAGKWDPYFQSTHNSLLFPTLLPALFSTLSGADVVIIIITIGCVYVSLIPLVLFAIYKEKFDSITAFLASFVFIFYPFIPQLATLRNCFAFLFASLLLLVLISREISSKNRAILGIVFTFSIITSHYGTAYIFLLVLITIFILSYVGAYMTKSPKKDNLVSPTFIALSFMMAFSWYVYTSGSANFYWGVNFAHHVLVNLQDFFSPEKSASMRAFLTPSFSLSFEVTKWLLFLLLLFITMGVVEMLYEYFKGRIDRDYVLLTLGFCSILIGITQMGMPRIFAFSLLLTSPLSVWGVDRMFKLVKVKGKTTAAFSLYLIILFSFTYGIVSNSLNTLEGKVVDMSLFGNFEEEILKGDNDEFKSFIYWSKYQLLDSVKEAEKWFFMHGDTGRPVYMSGLLGCNEFLFIPWLPEQYGGKIVSDLKEPQRIPISDVLKNDLKSGYVFIGLNETTTNYSLPIALSMSNKIYDSGGNVFYEVSGGRE